MNKQKALRLSRKWAQGHVCSLQDGEAEAYHAMFAAMLEESMSNEPLTLEQLREMDGEPVYIVFLPDIDGEKLQFWALVAVDEWGEIYLMNNLGGSSAYEEVWANIEAIYRRPPEGEENA